MIKKIPRKPDKYGKPQFSYKVVVRLAGHPPVYRTFKSKTEAQRFETTTTANILEGRQVLKTNERKMTVHDLFEEYKQIIERKNITQSTKDDYYRAFDFFDKEIGALYVCNVNYNAIKQSVNNLLNSRKVIKGSRTCKPKQGSKISNGTFNQRINYVSSAFNYALKKLNIIQFNPFDAVDRLHVQKKKHYIPTPHEINLLLQECRKVSEKLYLIVLLALVTVSRRGEIIDNLKIGSFDFDNKCVHILKNKQRHGKKEYKTIYLSDFVLNEVKNYMKNQKIVSLNKNDRFFSNLSDSEHLISKKYPEICRKLGLRTDELTFVFHSLRYCGTSYVGRYSQSNQITQAITGHKTPDMIDYYTNIQAQWTVEPLNHACDDMLSEFINSKNQ